MVHHLVQILNTNSNKTKYCSFCFLYRKYIHQELNINVQQVNIQGIQKLYPKAWPQIKTAQLAHISNSIFILLQLFFEFKLRSFC